MERAVGGTAPAQAGDPVAGVRRTAGGEARDRPSTGSATAPTARGVARGTLPLSQQAQCTRHNDAMRSEAAHAAARSQKKLAEALIALQETLDPEERAETADLLLGSGERSDTREGLEKLRARTAEEIRTARERSEDHRRKTQTAIDARTAVDEIRAEQEHQVSRPLEELLEQAQKAREIAVGAIAAHGLATKLPATATKVGPETARAETGRLAARLDMTKVDVRKRREACDREIGDTERAVDKALETAEIEAAGTTAAKGATIREHAEVTAAADHQAREEVARLRSIREPVEQLLRLHGQVTEHEGRLKEVADGPRASRFPKWLTLRRSTDLLRHGSRQLEKMSGGRYAFADPRETAEEWKVIDRWSGAARSPASLSGGEQFMAGAGALARDGRDDGRARRAARMHVPPRRGVRNARSAVARRGGRGAVRRVAAGPHDRRDHARARGGGAHARGAAGRTPARPREPGRMARGERAARAARTGRAAGNRGVRVRVSVTWSGRSRTMGQ